MKRYDIKASEKVLDECPNGLLWNTMVRDSIRNALVPTMKPQS